MASSPSNTRTWVEVLLHGARTGQWLVAGGAPIPTSALREALLHLQHHPDEADPRGLSIRGAVLGDTIDLAGFRLPCAFSLDQCSLYNGMDLTGGEFSHISVTNSRVSVRTAEAALIAPGVRVAGLLDFSGSLLANPNGAAAILDSAHVGASAMFLGRFTSWGEFRALGATIAGQLAMPGAKLRGGLSTAMCLDRARLGELVLEDGFTAVGELRATGLQIDGRLALSGARLTNPGEVALRLNEAHIGGSATLDRIVAQGELQSAGAVIKGGLSLRGASLEGWHGIALNLERAEVGGLVALDSGFKSRGGIRATHATITGPLMLSGAVITNVEGDSVILDGAHLGDAFLDKNFSSTGKISAIGASIDGQWAMRDARVDNGTETAVQLDALQCEDLLLDQGFKSKGAIRASGARIRGQMVLEGGTFANPSRTALNLEGAEIGHLVLQGVLRIDGAVVLAGAALGTVTLNADDSPPPGHLVADGWRIESVTGGASANSKIAQQWLSSRPPSLPFNPQPARALADVYERSGRPDLAIRMRYRAAKSVGSASPLPSRLWHGIFGMLVGHGYYPLRTLVWLAILFGTATALCFWRADLFFPSEPATAAIAVPATPAAPQPEAVSGATPCTELANYPCFVPWTFALQTVVPPAALLQSTAWQPDGWLLVALSLIGALSWTLAALLLAGITGLLRRT